MRLKSLSPSNRISIDCDIYMVVNVHHMVMQSPIHKNECILMYRLLFEYDPKLENIFSKSPERVFHWLLGWMKITCLIFGPYWTMQSMGCMDEFVQTDQVLGQTKKDIYGIPWANIDPIGASFKCPLPTFL